MLMTDDLENIWKNFKYCGKAEFEFVRVDKGSSIPQINIGFNSKVNRCLLLELPFPYKIDFLTTIKQNLTLSYFNDTGYVVLELTDNSYFDLFNDLIISIYQRIYKLSEVEEYSNIFIQMFYKWSEFFDDKKSNKLSQDIIKGLFGELFILKTLIIDTSSLYLNDLLSSWKGPYDKGHDFVFDKKNIEVKTKDISKSNVKISSEYQLEKEFAKDLELLVLSVENNYIEGISLSKLLNEVKEEIIKKMGDFSIVLTALSQKNITTQNISEYDNYCFKAKEKIIYECNDEFPKLTKSNIHEAISGITYTLQLKQLERFIINKENIND